ncbi:MAG: DUF5946 family protein [Pseudomonadota bacterium]
MKNSALNRLTLHHFPSSSETEICFSCGACTPIAPGSATHRYMRSSPGCWAAYGELLAREYGDPAFMRFHPLTVDAYALQHPGGDDPQSISSVHVHLASLVAYFDRGAPLHSLSDIRKDVVKRKASFERLVPPPSLGNVVVSDVLPAVDAAEHGVLVERWARSVYRAWSAHHKEVVSS